MNYTLLLRSYGFDQVILIAWIKCFIQKIFIILKCAWLFVSKSLNLHQKLCFQQSTGCGPLGETKMNKFLSCNFSRYNFAKLIRTLESVTTIMQQKYHVCREARVKSSIWQCWTAVKVQKIFLKIMNDAIFQRAIFIELKLSFLI